MRASGALTAISAEGSSADRARAPQAKPRRTIAGDQPNRRCVAIEVKLWRNWYWHRITRALDPATASGEAGFIGAAISRGCARPARKSVMAPGISERLRPDDRGKRMSRQLTDKGVPSRWLPSRRLSSRQREPRRSRRKAPSRPRRCAGGEPCLRQDRCCRVLKQTASRSAPLGSTVAQVAAGAGACRLRNRRRRWRLDEL